MRISRTRVLAGMLLRYFGRRVLRAGLLASRPVRVLVGVVLALLLAVAVTAAVHFLEPLRAEPEAWGLLLDVTTVSTVLWSLAATLLVKTLFLNAEGMLALTFALPVTSRERASAFVLYEAAMAGAVVAAGVAALSLATLVVRGPAALVPLVEAVVLPALLTYLVVGLAHQLLARLLRAVGLRRVQPVALVLALFVLLLAFASRVPGLTGRSSSAYLSGSDDRPWTSAVATLADHAGHPVALATAAALAAVLAVATVVLTPAQHVRQSRYLPISTRAGRTLPVGPYEWCVLRSFQTWLPLVLALALFASLCVRPAVHPLWALSLVSMGALYQFAATDPLRRLRSDAAPAWRTYLLLVRAQALLWAVCAVPAIAVVVAVDPSRWGSSTVPVVASLAGTLVALGVGIIFPAQDDNPFSVFMGLSLAAALAALLGLVVGVLSPPPRAAAAIAVAAVALFVLYSVIAIATSDSRRRHEEGPHPRQQRGGSRPAHPGARHGGAPAADVLERRRRRTT